MKMRFMIWLALFGTALSQLFNVTVRAPRYLIWGDIMVDPDETFSSVTGRMAPLGLRPWLRAEWVIDHLALPFSGWKLGHCRRAAARTLAAARA